MKTRRTFLTQTAAAAVVAATSVPVGRSTEHKSRLTKGLRIKSVIPREETIRRYGGDAGGLPMTWTADDQQLIVALDGCGWPENPTGHYFSTRVFALKGGAQNATFHDVPGYPDIPVWEF